MLDRREILLAGAAGLAAAPALAQTTSANGPADRLATKARETRQRLEFDGRRYAGAGYEWLRAQAAAAQFLRVGEEHGIAENPKLCAQLFTDLVPAGYAHVGIEIAPPMAAEIDRALRRGGLDGLRAFFADERTRVAFFTMREEAEWLAAACAARPGSDPVLWGLDYDIVADRHLIAMLEARRKPAAAAAALARLKAASAAMWADFARTPDVKYLFGFNGDPEMVRALRRAWPRPDAEADWILDTLEESLAINQLWIGRQGYASNARRAAFLRKNLLRHLAASRRGGRLPKAMFKCGSNHLVRGLNSVHTFDMGTLLPEVAALEGSSTFGLLVLPGTTSQIAQIDIGTFRYKPASAKDDYADGLDILAAAAWPDAFTLFDTHPLRPLAGSDKLPRALVDALFGYDAILIMSGSTPSTNL